MTRKFFDGIDTLKSLIKQSGHKGSWSEPNGAHQFQSVRGGVLTYWPTTNSVRVQGKAPGKGELETLLNTGKVVVSGTQAMPKPDKKIFVVYGHDQTARTQLEAMLRRWELEPVILDELPSKGQTIIEKLEHYTEDVGFAVVLATPDDVGYAKDHEDQRAYRVRQNVALELGMLLVKLGRPRVAILLGSQVGMERPSDIQGLIYIPFNDNLQTDAGPRLAKEMAAQGYNIDIKDL